MTLVTPSAESRLEAAPTMEDDGNYDQGKRKIQFDTDPDPDPEKNYMRLPRIFYSGLLTMKGKGDI